MSLTASMWTSVSGLLAHGEKMNVVGNNIANVNTVGFKASRMDFQDFVHQTVNAASGPAQVGRGTSIGAIYGDFSQGAFETSNETTDLGISGKGFFKVVPKNGDDAYYTRAGNFRFDAQGYLVDPHGYVLQGWGIERPTLNLATSSGTSAATATNTGSRIVGTGVPQDVRLASFSCDPKHTTNMTVAVNLDSNSGAEKARNDANPFAALFENWNIQRDANTGKFAPPLGTNGFAFQSSMTVYDEGGTPHVLTIYFDPVEENDVNGIEDPQNKYWEFLVTMDPSEDKRVFLDDDLTDGDGNRPAGGATVPDDKLGLLMSGTLTFNTSGQFQDMMAFVPTVGGAGFADPSTWVPAPISSNGFPMFAANFSGRPGASEVWDQGAPAIGTNPARPVPAQPTVGAPGSLNPEAIGYYTELNLGLGSTSNWWQIPGTATDPYTLDSLSRVPGPTFAADGKYVAGPMAGILGGFGPAGQLHEPYTTA
ncbi:MAG: flagellar hook-basal body complex protein, partial [Deltaproteobacteria bacterium]|nr:flagellar hook-basal body complex protein [Deltaproteobacteria bacterium]